MEQSIEKIIQKTILFNNLSDEAFQAIYPTVSWSIRHYVKGDVVDDLIEGQKALGFVITGRLQAMKNLISGKSMYLKRFKTGNMFGAGGLFQNNLVHLSYMEVTSNAQVAFITESELIKLFQYEQVLQNYLGFMNTRVRYLNQKIDIISQSTIHDRLLMYFNDQKLIQGSTSEIQLPINKSDLAEFIGVSRASLYRIFDEMEQAGDIEIHHNQIVFK